MRRTEAIVDHPEHGRLLIAQGYGGNNDLRGGAYRWEHGSLFSLRPGDTFARLEGGEWNDEVNLYQAVVHGHDESRPVLEWPGYMMAAMAESAGL